MKKKYVAKYLPVEGKVEMGDKFIDTGVMNLIGTRSFQKVKLLSNSSPSFTHVALLILLHPIIYSMPYRRFVYPGCREMKKAKLKIVEQ